LYHRHRYLGSGAERIVRATGALGRHCYRRQVICTRHAVIHKRTGEQLAAGRVVDAVLSQRLADALHDATMDLALDDHRIQHDADVVDGGVGDESQFAGIRIDLDLGDMTAAGEGEIHRIEESDLSRPGSRMSSGKPSGGKYAAPAISPNVMLRSVPLTVNLPAVNSMSCSLASSR
jgi:hypothetical protein